MSLLANSNAIESGGYPIQRSLRFRSSASAYLSRTPASAGNRQKFTWSGWVKRGNGGAVETNKLFTASSGANETTFGFGGGDTIRYYDYQGGYNAHLVTTPVYRDFSAWYHLVLVVDTTDATSTNRVKIYVNGSQVTALGTAVYPAQNSNTMVDATNSHYIASSSYGYFDGYLAEVNFIDGQALTPSSFGQTDAVTGVWTPKKYAGTYGTNGFYLPFSDNTSATTLAYDKSGNGNNWTPNNISTTAGATYDSMTDVPTLTSATAANYCVLNPLDKGTSVNVTDGNLAYSVPTAASYGGVRGTFAITQKAYWEVTNTCGALPMFIGILNASVNVIGTADLFSVSGQATYRSSNGNKNINGTETAYGASNTTNDVIGVAYDPDTGELTFYKNGTSQGTISTGFTGYTYFPAVYDSTSSVCSAVFNFGQRPFSYTPPTGFKALNTFNLPDPTIKKPSSYMNVVTATGNGTNPRSITGTGFQPDLVWTKNRSVANEGGIWDSVRGSGSGKVLIPSATAAEGGAGVAADSTYGYLTSFDSDGFSSTNGSSLNSYFNTNAQNYVYWQWKKGATPGFDIVTYTGNGANRTISHSLGVAPSMMIVKSRSQGTTGYTGNWAVWHSAIANTEYLLLNTTAAKATGATYWNSTTPTSSVFSLGTAAVVNNNNDNFVNYLFAEIPQFSKAFSFTGNGSADGSFVHLGFKPKLVLLKCSSTTGNWYMFDTVRNTYNVLGEQLYPNLSNAGSTVTTLDALSNGFKMRLAGDPNAAQTYIGFAWADVPFKFTNAF